MINIPSFSLSAHMEVSYLYIFSIHIQVSYIMASCINNNRSLHIFPLNLLFRQLALCMVQIICFAIGNYFRDKKAYHMTC